MSTHLFNRREHPVPSQRYIYLHRRAIVRQDADDQLWYVVHKSNGHRAMTTDRLASWDDAMAVALDWTGLLQ